MKPFSVWIRPWGTDGKVRVENITSTTWLLDRLSRFFVFKGRVSGVTHMVNEIQVE